MKHAFCLFALLLACSPMRPLNAAPHRTSPPAGKLALAAVSQGNAPLGWIAVRELDALLGTLAGDDAKARATAELGVSFAATLGVSGALAATIDAKRPILVFAMEPTATAGPLPIVVVLPVFSTQSFLVALATTHTVRREAESSVHEFAKGPRRGFVRFAGSVAYVAYAKSLLTELPDLPPLTEPASIELHLELARIRELFPELSLSFLQTLAALASPGSAHSPQAAYDLRRLRRVAQHAAQARSMSVVADLDALGLTLTVALARPRNSFDAVAPAPPAVWGTELMPADAMLVYMTSVWPTSQRADVADLMAYITALRPPGGRSLAPLATALDAASRTLGDQAIYAVWPASHGGIGMGGALRVAPGSLARLRWLDAYEALAPALAVLVPQELGFAPEAARFHVRVQRGASRIAGVSADAVELSPTFASTARREERLFRWLFGPTLVLRTAFVGGTALYAAGRDATSRLETMIQAVRGRTSASLAQSPAFAKAYRFHPEGRVALTFLSTSGLARFVMSALAGLGALSPAQTSLLEVYVAADEARTAIVTTANVLRSDEAITHQISSFLPRSAVLTLGALGAAMWRVALSLFFGPPALPPLPAPPAEVTPPSDTGGERPGVPRGALFRRETL